MQTKSLSLFYRLTEVEKIGIRSATLDRLMYLSGADLANDLFGLSPEQRVAVLLKVQALIELQYKAKVEATFGKSET